eukprot:gnl/TRDRNA2_/TRDRNA2_140282_c3_seq1.p1 gnl/TRDRNA2_/TRDRNA2_140282_c3~~gnl/TRDRNA2_/TRDRNA2_140282_c3_seq1.p1  ORF type:complete len:214 (-),score=33.52 gnl/TRDRNA2_/TRDRNA2_140282_c3_seq1:221-799(-)
MSQIVVIIILAFTIDMTGRRPIVRIAFLVAMFTCLGIAWWGHRDLQPLGSAGPVLEGWGTRSVIWLIVLFSVVLSCLRIVWVAVWNTVLEAYPTTVRGSAVGIGQIFVRICAFVCPSFVVPPLEEDGSGKAVTFSVIAIFLAIGLIGAVLLPVETAGKAMADVVPLDVRVDVQDHKTSEDEEAEEEKKQANP